LRPRRSLSPFQLNVLTTAFLSLTIDAVHRSSFEDFCAAGRVSRTESPFGENTVYGAEISMDGYFVSIVKSGACEREVCWFTSVTSSAAL
jgi:hypothetical protein